MEIGDPRLLLWSADDEASGDRRRRALARLVGMAGEDALGDIAALCATQARRPYPQPVRGAVVATSAAEAVRKLDGYRAAPVAQERPVALLFPGQGSQYHGMATGLYGHEPAFTAALDDAFAALGPGGAQLREEWLSGHPDVPMDDGSRAQPLLFAIGYALGTMVCSWGVRPTAVLGHSVGEMVAATVAGVFSLADAARLMRERITAVVATPPGGMLAVAATAEEMRPFVGSDGVAIAAINAPRQTMLAGPDGPLTIVEEKLRAAGYTVRRAKSRQAFHSPVMRDACAATADVVAAVTPRPPSRTLYSAYTGGVLTAETARDPGFWADQLAEPVLFWPALEALLVAGDHILIEAGPGQGLTTVARQHPAVRARTSDVVSLLPARPSGPAADREAAVAVAARLWLEGHPLRWREVRGAAERV